MDGGRGYEPEPFEPFEVLERELVYDSPWCSLRKDRVRVPSGAERVRTVKPADVCFTFDSRPAAARRSDRLFAGS